MSGNFQMSTWTEFKTLAIAKQLGLHYIEYGDRYELAMNEGVLVWTITLPKDEGADVINFETYFKALANRPSFFLGQFRNRYSNITGNTTSTVKSGNGVIRGISINNNNTGGTVILYDSLSATGTKIATFNIGTASGGLLSSTGLQPPLYMNLTAEFTTGLTVRTTGHDENNITIYYT